MKLSFSIGQLQPSPQFANHISFSLKSHRPHIDRFIIQSLCLQLCLHNICMHASILAHVVGSHAGSTHEADEAAFARWSTRATPPHTLGLRIPPLPVPPLKMPLHPSPHHPALRLWVLMLTCTKRPTTSTRLENIFGTVRNPLFCIGWGSTPHSWRVVRSTLGSEGWV